VSAEPTLNRLRRPATRILLLAATVLLGWLALPSNAQTVRYLRLPREVVEKRLSRYAGSNTQREVTLKEIFSGAGCDSQHLSEQFVQHLKQPNVICLLPGTSRRGIIVGAHFDHVPNSDGVVDNWSGASLLPSLYEAVKVGPRTHRYIFIGFAGEEAGEIGSQFYARHMTIAEVAATDAMVNLDTLGLGPTKVWASHSDKRLLGALASIAKRLDLPVSIVNVEQVGSSDSEQFAARKIPRITVHSLTQETWQARIIHSPRDQISAMRMNDYYQSYELLAAYIVSLDQISEESTAAAQP
jgi:hypothetical protein